MRGLVWALVLLMGVSLAANVWQWREMRAAKDGCYTDTVTVTDTVIIREPVVRDSVVVKTVTRFMRVADTLCVVFRDTVHDSILVEVPIMQRMYADTDYVAWVSGFEPKLDSIQVFRRETVIRTKSRRCGIGVQAGYGIATDGLSPYIGLGLSYRLF